jgi:hypothetical protein
MNHSYGRERLSVQPFRVVSAFVAKDAYLESTLRMIGAHFGSRELSPNRTRGIP